MARIRSIKPEFWTSEQVMDLSPNARLLFIGLWNFCDDAGIHPASLKRLKAEIMPADDVCSDDVRRMIDECINVGLIREYEIDGEAYWAVTGWHHQKIDQPSYKYPSEDGTVPEGPAKRRQSAKNAQPVRGVFDERSPPEGKGEEGNGEEGKEPRKKPEPKSKGSRIPADWRLTPDLLDEAKRIGPSVDAQREAAKFRDYWLAASGQNAVKADWDATWRNWIRRAADGPPGAHPIHAASSDSPASSRPL